MLDVNDTLEYASSTLEHVSVQRRTQFVKIVIYVAVEIWKFLQESDDI
jgi:hypothetical protein